MAGRLRSGLQGWRFPVVFIGGLLALLSSIFAGALFVSAGGPDEVEVRVFVDLAGDGLDSTIGDVDHPVAPGVDVHVWEDNGSNPNLPDATDTFVTTLITDPTGTAVATGLDPTRSYWVSVDSTDITPPGGTTGVGSAVAEQTFGPTGSLVDMASPLTTAPGPVYGGVDPLNSDIDASDILVADHLALIDAGSPVADFGFSFNVVTNADGGVVQGSLRQFVNNANAVVGPNTMRFVPMVGTNGTAVAASWWQVGGTSAIIVSDADTIIDGTAYAPDGSTVDSNPGLLSANAGSAVGTAGATLPNLERPELQVTGHPIQLQASGSLIPVRSGVRNVHLGGGFTTTPLRVNGVSGGAISDVVFDRVIIGTVDPGTVTPKAVHASSLITTNFAPDLVIRDSYLTESASVLITVNNSPSATITGTELGGAVSDGFNALVSSPGMVVSGNRFFGANDYCVDAFQTGVLIEDNTFINCGDSSGQSGGVRIGDLTGTIRRNVFQNNNGPGITIAGQNTAQGRVAGRAVISRNHFIDNVGLAIDNYIATTDNFINGDGITLNDGALTADAGNAFLDFPVLTTVAPGPPGTVDVSGTSCAGCVVEIFSAQAGSGETEAAVPLPHGEGIVFLASGTADGAGDFTINIPSAGVTEITATATDSALAATSEFSQNSGLQLISGRVLNDVNGDANMSDAIPIAGATVRIYRDLASDSPGIETPAAGDPLLATLSTDATGRWSFANAIIGSFWVTVDSRTIAPPALNTGFVATDVWADQTFGPAGSLRALGSGGVEFTAADGPVVAGRTGTGSDTATTLVTSEHVFRVDAATPRLDLDTGFSFNVVTNLEGGDNTDLAPEGNRTVQGTMRQFIQNANAVAGPNTMRFAPAVPTNAAGGGHTWWQMILTAGLPSITDSDTTVNGDARQWNSPVNGIDGTATAVRPDVAVGANSQMTGTVDLPELLLWGNRATEPAMDGIRVHAPRAVVEDVAMLGFDDGIEVGVDGADTTSSATISTTALGVDIATQGDPGTSNRLNRAVHVRGGQQATIGRNVIGFTKESAVMVASDQPGFLIERNQILQAGMESAPATSDGVTVAGGGAGTISLNHISGSRAGGIDLPQTANSVTIADNTVDGFGSGGSEQFGIRVYGTGSVVQDNVILNGVGSAVAIVGENAVPSIGRPGSQITVTGNTYGPIAAGINPAATIDLIGPTIPDIPDGPTANDGSDGCGLTPGYGNQGLDVPVIAVEVIGSSWHLTGTGCPDSSIELYAGNSGTGLATTRILQTSVQPDGSIDTTFPALAETHVTAAQTNVPGSTSEFGPVIAVTGALPPVLTNPGPQSATESAPFSLSPVGSDPDSSPVSWAASGMPTGMTIDPSTGELAWTPGETDGGSSFSITLDLTGGGVTVSETFSLSVIEGDQPPIVAPIPDGSTTVGSPVSQPVSGSDPDDPAVPLTWSLQGTVPAGMTIDPSSGTITYTPAAAGSSTVQVVATQPNLISGSNTWTVTATAVATNSPPVVSAVSDRTVLIDDRIEIPISATDPDGPLSHVVLVGPPGMIVDPGGLVIWDNAGPVGTQNVTIRVSDSGSPSMSTDVSFVVQVTLPTTTSPPVTGGGTTTTVPSSTSRPSTSTSTSTPSTSTSTSTPSTTAPIVPTTVDPTTQPPTRLSLPVDEPSMNVVVPELGPPSDGPGQPTLSLSSGIGGLLRAPGSFQIPPTTIGLAGAWIFVLGVPLVLWERKRAVNVVVGVDAGETLPVYATRNSTYPFAYLRADASMLWSRYRFMGLGEGQRVKVESPVGPVWVDRRHMRPLHQAITEREEAP